MRRFLPLRLCLAATLSLAACRPNAAAITPASAATTEPFRALPAAQSAKLPDHLADSTWWGMVRAMSEPGGYFRSENFVSNEMGLQHVIARLRVTSPPGGVYVGVGPEQNFTYIAALQPRVAFIVDIRRQNLLQHLWYKAVFELSPTRSAFLARLFARPLASTTASDQSASADSLIARLETRAADSAYFRRTFAEVRDHLVRTHGPFKLCITFGDLHLAISDRRPCLSWSHECLCDIPCSVLKVVAPE